MQEIDTTSIDQTTHLGQITMLLAVAGILFSAISPFLPKRGPQGHKSRIDIMRERLELEEKNGTIVREVNRNLSEWQLIARAMIRLLKNEVVDAGGEVSQQAMKLEEQLQEIDHREVDYGGDESS